MNRRTLPLLAAPLALAVLAACGSGGGSQPKVTSSAPTDKVLHLSFLQDPGQPPDPDIYYAGQGLILTQNLYEGLLSYKLGADKPEIAPGLATAYQVSPDKATYTLTLRPGVTFHDGTPFTSAAVKTSFDRRRAVNQGPAYMVADVTSVETPSPTKVVIKLKAPNSAFLDYLASPYGPKMMSPTALAAHGSNDHAQKWLQTHDIGTGRTRSPGPTSARPTRCRPTRSGGAARRTSRRSSCRSSPTCRPQQLLLNKGQLAAILHDLNAPAVKSYLGNNGVASYALPSFLTEQVYVNPNNGLFKDVAARKAFQQALDVPALAQEVFSGRGTPAAGNYPDKLLPAGTDHQVIGTDPTALQKIATAAPASSRTVTLGYDTSQPDDQQLANIVSAKLQGLGVQAKVQGYPTSQVFGWVSSLKGAPDALFTSFWPDAAHPYTAAHILYASDGGLNYLHCSDPTITGELPAALKTGDDALYSKIGYQASATGCWTNVVYRKDFMVAQKWLKGLPEAHDISAPFSLRIAALSAS